MKNIIAITDKNANVITEDPWQLLSATEVNLHTQYKITPAAILIPYLQQGSQPPANIGVMLDPDDDPEILEPWIDTLSLIMLQFPDFKDGRAYSQANLLRTRYKFKGEIRAIGDVLRDQLAAMQHCGFTSFAVREDKSAAEAIKGLIGFDFIYARSVTQPSPLFRQR